MSENDAAPLPSDRAGGSESVAEAMARSERRIAAVEAESRRCDTASAGGAVAWRIWGNGEPLLLLHGGAGSWTHWIANIPALAERYTVIAPDLPGFGDSALPEDRSADGVADALLAGLRTIVGCDAPFPIAAFSFGCVAAGHLSARIPERVRSLMLVGVVGLGVARNRLPALHRVDSEMPPADRWRLQRENLAMQMLATPERIDDLAVCIHDRNLLRARLSSSRLSRRETLGPILKDLPVPVAALWGSRDSVYGADTEERTRFIEALPRPGPVTFIAGAGHWAQYEAPAAVNEAMMRWLATGRSHIGGRTEC